jgi:hypothetical protein
MNVSTEQLFDPATLHAGDQRLAFADARRIER